MRFSSKTALTAFSKPLVFLITYEKLKETVEKMIKANKDSIYKDGFMPVKLISALGEERKAVIDKIAKEMNN